jgi:hypothetical protein
MHSYPAPGDALDGWLKSDPSTNGRYGHLLLEQKAPIGNELVTAFRPYFESAHLDAREFFHAQIGIDLHPDADAPGAHATYPTCLPETARRGLFGEVMAGMLTEHYDYVGGHEWRIPIFLFRYHADVEVYLFDLARDPTRVRSVFGRFGSDFLGLSLNEAGEVVRFIAGEAKWRQSLQPSVVDELMHGEWVTKPDKTRARSGRGIWYQVNNDPSVPHGARQLQRLLQQRDPEGYAATILSLDRALLVRDGSPTPRTNLILIAGNDVPSRSAGTSLLSKPQIPSDYTALHDLQVVELIVTGGEALIDALYGSLWSEVPSHGSA